MRVLIAPDKFKGSLDAYAVAENIALGVRDVLSTAEIEIAPVADGGEGTAEIIRRACNGQWVHCSSHDSTGRPIESRYVWLAENGTAVMEMSEVAGARRVALHERDVLNANTFGVGEMIDDATRRKASRVIIGLGGSATNDGGFGMARALGFRFLGNEGDQELKCGPSGLEALKRIVPPPSLHLPEVIAAVDVQNPLLGLRGATRVFGPQKGATGADIILLEEALTRLADTITRIFGTDFRNVPGAGAAGGLGFGLLSFCRAQLRPGFEVVANAIRLEEKIRHADVVITGEGRLDAQTLEGKAPAGVARLARRLQRRVYAVVGEIDPAANVESLFDKVLALARPPVSRTASIKLAPVLLRERAAELVLSLR